MPVALTGRSRLLGLALLPRGRAGPGLLIPRCSSIHTFGMRFELDLLFLDANDEVVKRRNVPPWRIASCRGSSAVLELPAERVELLDGEAAISYSLTQSNNGNRDQERENHRGSA